MTVKVFGQLRDIIEHDNISIGDMNDVNDLKHYLYNLFPALKEKEFAVAVNKQIIHDNVLLQHDAEIAILPPYSGG